MKILLPCALLLLLHAQMASATTYFVDAARGSDGWSGRLADPAAPPAEDGPWQSLLRVSRAALAPGDTIAMRCGSIWSEPLKLSVSGTAALPIVVRPYPSPCAGANPTIDGFARTNAAQWTRHGPNLYKVQLPFALLSNSRFDQGLGRWQAWSPAGDAKAAVLSGCGPDGSACMQMNSGVGQVTSVFHGATFPMVGGVGYRLRFDFKAAVGTRLRAFVRRASPPYDVVGVANTANGNGAWQSVSVAFTGLSQLDNARLDFDLPPGGLVASVDNVVIEQQVGAPFSAMLGAVPLVVSHHPNRGYNAVEPTSPYLRTAADADVVATANGGTGSTYVPTGSDFTLPTGAQLQTGTSIRIRTNAWIIDERKVVGQSGNRLLLDRPTSYPLKSGWGYYFTGAAWMADEASEWVYDSVASTVLVRTATDTPPSTQFSLGTLDACVDISGMKYLSLDSLELAGCKTGVRANASTGVILQRMRITDIGSNGVFAPASRNLQVLSSRIERTGEHAILGQDLLLGIATGMVVRENTVIDAGVTRLNGKVISLPVSTLGAMLPGTTSSVVNNSISGAGYNGIRTLGNGLIKGNLVSSACLVLDDCAGIYAYGAGLGSRIEENVVRDVLGGLDGKPVGSTSQGQGIFLDDHANSVTVLRNTVSNAESGILLHNAYNNNVQANILYGNRKHQIWLYEDSNIKSPEGDIYGNVIADNIFFSTSPSAAVGQQSFIKDTTRFASYDRNRYSALISNRVVSEDWPTGSGSFHFPAWQRATTPTGGVRNPEPNGSVVNAVGYANFRILGENIVRNGTMTAGNAEWSAWNDRLPLATAQAVSCNGQTCLDVNAGASVSLVATPPFSIVGSNWYRVSFDVRSAIAGQPLSVMVRRSGGGSNGYESLMGSAEMITGQTTFQRFSFAFKAVKTINAADPITRDAGARIYFDRIAPGNRITLANVEVVPVSAADATMQTILYTNSGATSMSVDCPDNLVNPARCGQYLDFATATKLTWPLYVAPKSSVVVYTRDTTLVDSDGDGISDAQDQCPATPIGMAVNAAGCSQTP